VDACVLNPALRQQSLGRALSADEAVFAVALEAVFAEGHHRPEAAAAALQARGAKHPNGTTTLWSADTLAAALQALNAALDAAYSAHGIGP
jgi:hypothetical protein